MNIAQMESNNPVQAISVAAPAPHRDVNDQPDASAGAAPVSGKHITQMIEEIQNQLQRMHVSLEFSHYGGHGERIAVVVADKTTGEVIREIPSKEIQNLYNKINDLVGIIFDRQA